jgi:hypothetical protein
MKKPLPLLFAALVAFTTTPALSQTNNASEARRYFDASLRVMKEADHHQGPGYNPDLLPKALPLAKKAYELDPSNPSNLDLYAAVLFYNGNTLHKPALKLSSCPLLREAAAKDGILSKEILGKFWKDCAVYGNRLYLADDNRIRIQGTASGGGGMGVPGWVTPGRRTMGSE